MNKRRFGRTGLQVSEISLGTVELGMDYGIAPVGADARPDAAGAERLLNRALDLGINFIDTARLYGESEAIIGRVLSGRRREFVLASKVPSFHAESLTAGELRARVRSSVEESLRALRTDVIDLMMIHSAPSEVILGGEVIGALEELRDEGSIRFVGASVYGEEAALLAIRSDRYDALQIAYNLLDRRPEKQVLAEAQAAGVGIVVRSVLLKGALTHRWRQLPEALTGLRSAAARVEELANGETAELAYRYVLNNPLIHTALVGTCRLDELEATVRYASRGPLPEEVDSQIRAISVGDEAQLNPGTWQL